MSLSISSSSVEITLDTFKTSKTACDCETILCDLKKAFNDPNLSFNQKLKKSEQAIAESQELPYEEQAKIRLCIFFYFSYRIIECKEELASQKSFHEIHRIMKCLNSCVSQKLILFVGFHDYTLPLVQGVLPELQAAPYQAITILNEVAKDENSRLFKKHKKDFTYIYDTLADEIDLIRNS
ncbi:MAG: hypothetical protein CMO81_11090 [Waddliaceae bacterium]|nr:hypothetical protein [Waddliaceae bacterium]